MSIRLEPIDADNWYECSQLRVQPDQERFVTGNLLCIAEVQFYPGWGAYAVRHRDKMVDFVMYEHDEETDEWWISNLMIAAEHQGLGYGRVAIGALIGLMSARGCGDMRVGYADDNEAARRLYRSLGFEEEGLDDEGDMVARLRPGAHSQ